ncbi:hypothetical protein V8C42DRAFT_312608 [Trichoderma barbatum]
MSKKLAKLQHEQLSPLARPPVATSAAWILRQARLRALQSRLAGGSFSFSIPSPCDSISRLALFFSYAAGAGRLLLYCGFLARVLDATLCRLPREMREEMLGSSYPRLSSSAVSVKIKGFLFLFIFFSVTSALCLD